MHRAPDFPTYALLDDGILEMPKQGIGRLRSRVSVLVHLDFGALACGDRAEIEQLRRRITMPLQSASPSLAQELLVLEFHRHPKAVANLNQALLDRAFATQIARQIAQRDDFTVPRVSPLTAAHLGMRLN